MAMAFTSALTAGSMASDSEASDLQGIEALKLNAGPVRRNLFGPVDHQQLQQDFQQLLRMSVEVANKRWNFDFQRDVPGEGADVEWVELRCQDVPAFYRACSVRRGVVRRKVARTPSSSSLSEEDGSPVCSSWCGSGDEYLEVTTRECYPHQRLDKRRQSAITEFFKVKKREASALQNVLAAVEECHHVHRKLTKWSPALYTQPDRGHMYICSNL